MSDRPIISIPAIEADLAIFADGSSLEGGAAGERIMSAVPTMLIVLKAAIKYAETDCADWHGQILCTTIDRLID